MHELPGDMPMESIHDTGSKYTNLVLVADNRAHSGEDSLCALREHALFRAVRAEHVDELLRQSRYLRLGHHQLLYRQDMPAYHFFFVVSGCLRLYRLDASGIDRTLDSIAPGECFAEVMIYAEPARYACYAEVLKSCEVLMMPIKAYRDLLLRYPEYVQPALNHFAQRAVTRFRDLEVMTVLSARKRLVRYLLDLLPDDIDQSGEVELPLPKCQVASRLAMQPETLSRILAGLKTSGLVRVNRSRLFIPDTKRLVEICS